MAEVRRERACKGGDILVRQGAGRRRVFPVCPFAEISDPPYAAERPGHALSGAFRIIEDRTQQVENGPSCFGVVHLELSGKDKGGSPAADKVNEDVHGVSHEHGSFLLGFPYGFQQHKGMARMDS